MEKPKYTHPERDVPLFDDPFPREVYAALDNLLDRSDLERERIKDIRLAKVPFDDFWRKLGRWEGRMASLEEASSIASSFDCECEEHAECCGDRITYEIARLILAAGEDERPPSQ